LPAQIPGGGIDTVINPLRPFELSPVLLLATRIWDCLLKITGRINRSSNDYWVQRPVKCKQKHNKKEEVVVVVVVVVVRLHLLPLPLASCGTRAAEASDCAANPSLHEHELVLFSCCLFLLLFLG
jgi:hypothetical protein